MGNKPAVKTTSSTMAGRISTTLFFLFCVLAALSTTNAFAPVTSVKSVQSSADTALNVGVFIEVGDGESIDSALRRFKKEVNKSGHLKELRHRRYFENSQEKKKRKKKDASIRRKFERMNRKRMQNRT